MQKGRIERRGNCWLLRYCADVTENGQTVRKQVAKKLATLCPAAEYKRRNGETRKRPPYRCSAHF